MTKIYLLLLAVLTVALWNLALLASFGLVLVRFVRRNIAHSSNSNIVEVPFSGAETSTNISES